MKAYEITINEAYIIDPFLPCASLQVYKDKVYLEATSKKQASKQAITSAWYTWRKSLKAMPEMIETVAIREL